uniref:Uncharacterized protein n=1 Tax=Alexandrium catenella TaxID=2925 RepID=A0A7S1REN8_ALECA|mmetsp:Transcript_54329/g.145448  ORF Transcript_54329/g.145448 Transcript_54329/m.145448 type:complete len:153 (+) Transcript_54329:248-706(+)
MRSTAGLCCAVVLPGVHSVEGTARATVAALVPAGGIDAGRTAHELPVLVFGAQNAAVPGMLPLPQGTCTPNALPGWPAATAGVRGLLAPLAVAAAAEKLCALQLRLRQSVPGVLAAPCNKLPAPRVMLTGVPGLPPKAKMAVPGGMRVAPLH